MKMNYKVVQQLFPPLTVIRVTTAELGVAEARAACLASHFP